MPIYNKLVRDKILEIIKANGQKSTHKILTAEELEKIRAEKAEKRGGFEKKIFLVEVMD